MRKALNKYDLLVLLCIFALFFVSFVVIHFNINRERGAYARISAEGQISALSLSVDIEGHEIITSNGINILEIKGGAVRMTGASCRGGDCLRLSRAYRTGQFIVCLPNRVVIEIIGTARAYGTDGTDAVTR